VQEERLKSNAFEMEISRLQKEILNMEFVVNSTTAELEMIQDRLATKDLQQSVENETKNKEDRLSNEAILIATAAVQQSNEREKKLKQKLGAIGGQFNTLRKERDYFQDTTVKMQTKYKEEVEETERKNQQETQNLSDALGESRDKYAILKKENEQTKLSYKTEQTLDHGIWEQKLSNMAEVNEGIITGLKEEIALLTQDKSYDIEKNDDDSEINRQYSNIEATTDNEVGSKRRQSIGSLWLRILFRKSGE